MRLLPPRHWFQFRLTALFAAIAVLAAVGPLWQEYQARTVLEGTWVALAPRHAGLKIEFHHDKLTIANRAGSRTSDFLIRPAAGTIRILRDDGVQEGVYRLADDHLELNLSDVGRQPPSQLYQRSRDAENYLFRHEVEPPRSMGPTRRVAGRANWLGRPDGLGIESR